MTQELYFTADIDTPYVYSEICDRFVEVTYLSEPDAAQVAGQFLAQYRAVKAQAKNHSIIPVLVFPDQIQALSSSFVGRLTILLKKEFPKHDDIFFKSSHQNVIDDMLEQWIPATA